MGLCEAETADRAAEMWTQKQKIVHIEMQKNALQFLKICYLRNDIFHGKPTKLIAVYELQTEVFRIVEMMQRIHETLIAFFIGSCRSKSSPLMHQP